MLNCIQKLLASIAARTLVARLEIGSKILPTDKLGPVVCLPRNGKMEVSRFCWQIQHRSMKWNCETQLEKLMAETE